MSAKYQSKTVVHLLPRQSDERSTRIGIRIYHGRFCLILRSLGLVQLSYQDYVPWTFRFYILRHDTRAESLSLVVQRSNGPCQLVPHTQPNPNHYTQATSLSSTPLRPTLSHRCRHTTTGATTTLCELLPSCDTYSVEVSLALE
jgi:hypothetical protein